MSRGALTLSRYWILATRPVRWLALDAALFDSAAADLVRLAGLRHSIAKLTASVSSDPGEAMKAGTTTLAWSARQ